jgi:hypothetical protein
MKWNPIGNHRRHWQTSRRGTSKAHEYYFVTAHGATGGKFVAGFYGYGRQVVMTSAGEFDTAQEAREYCEKVDREAVLITAM